MDLGSYRTARVVRYDTLNSSTRTQEEREECKKEKRMYAHKERLCDLLHQSVNISCEPGDAWHCPRHS